jgi:DNA-binding response OmpR family regulator
MTGDFDLLALDIGLPLLDWFAVLRRLRAEGSSLPVIILTARDSVSDTVLRHGDLSLDLRTRRASVGDRVVDLSAREFALAETFLRNPGQVLSREQLLSHVWGYDFDPGSNVVDVYVRYLRRKLGPQWIETARGMGYRLAVPR